MHPFSQLQLQVHGNFAFIMASSKCLKLALPFLDALELTRSSASSKELSFCGNSVQLWEALCQRYLGEDLLTQRGVKVPWPKREDENPKEYFETLYELFIFITQKDAISCDTCKEWAAIEDDALECEECLGKWCGSCAHRGPSKRDVPCKECPDFSQSHCWECFAEGKNIQCECSGTDSWHSCCGRHAFNCSKCDATLCDGCQDRHDYDCPRKGETDSGEEDGQEWRGSRGSGPHESPSHRSDQHWIDLDTVYRSVVRAATFFGVPIGNSLQMSTALGNPEISTARCDSTVLRWKNRWPSRRQCRTAKCRIPPCFFRLWELRTYGTAHLAGLGSFRDEISRNLTKSHHITSSARSGILGFVWSCGWFATYRLAATRAPERHVAKGGGVGFHGFDLGKCGELVFCCPSNSIRCTWVVHSGLFWLIRVIWYDSILWYVKYIFEMDLL